MEIYKARKGQIHVFLSATGVRIYKGQQKKLGEYMQRKPERKQCGGGAQRDDRTGEERRSKGNLWIVVGVAFEPIYITYKVIQKKV